MVTPNQDISLDSFDTSKIQNEQDIDKYLSTLAQKSKYLFLSGPKNTTSSALEKAIDLAAFETIFVESPITTDYFDLQRLLYKEKNVKTTQVLLNSKVRRDHHIQELRNHIAQATLDGARITSVTIISTQHVKSSGDNNSESFMSELLESGIEDIELLFFLTHKQVHNLYCNSNSLAKPANHFLLAGELSDEIPFTLQLINQKEHGSLHIHITLNTGETLNTTVKRDTQLSKESPAKYFKLEDLTKAVRVAYCALESLKTGKAIILKHVEGLTPIQIVGTAAFLDMGLFVPASPNQKVAVTGLYSTKEDKVKEIFNRIVKTGEPLEYIPNYESLMDVSFAKKKKPILYVPSIPGKRKDQEMIDALNAGYYVLAEKPAFANADLAKSFGERVSLENQKRLFFGWHYQHHYVFKKVWKDVANKTFGEIKHITAKLQVPMILHNSRIFEPSQGGVGLDLYCYPLHLTLRLIGFHHAFEVLESKIQSAQDLDPTNPVLTSIDFTLDSKLKFGNGMTADISATFDSTIVIYSQAEICFENGTKIFLKSFGLPHFVINTGFKPAYIQKAGSPKWEEYITPEDLSNPEYYNSTYYQQIEFVRRQATGEESYDWEKDTNGLGVEANMKLHAILDAVFEKGGFQKKVGA